MPLFNEEIVTNALENFVESILKKHLLKADAKEISQMILEELEKEARKTGKTQVGIGIDDSELEKAIIKAPSLLDEWKKSKEKKNATSQTKKKETKKVETKKEEKKEVKAQKQTSNPIKIERSDNSNDKEIEFTLFDY